MVSCGLVFTGPSSLFTHFWCTIMWFCEVLLLGAFLASVAPASVYRLCVLPRTPSYFSNAPICDSLSFTPIRCVLGVDRLDCMQKIKTGEADFAVFEAEDLLIASDDRHLSDVLVTHRIHATEEKMWEFAVVALVSDKAKVSKLADLKGKRLCHPGSDPFSVNYDWSEVFSLYFENRVAPKVCDKDISVEENRIRGLAQFFGESCRPGIWAADPELDLQLKRKYESMCGLCDVPSVCSKRDKYWGRQGALYCLSDCLGDVAWSMLQDARLHFSNVGVSVCSDVSLLCPDGSTMPLNSTEPCLWLTRPVPVIAAKRNKAEDIQKMLKQVLRMPDTPDDFIRLLESNIANPPLQLRPSVTPNDYLAPAPGFLSANSVSGCGQGARAVTLCVSTLVDKIKCDWLADVSRVYGLEPSLSCMYGANCLVSVANKSADVTITDTDKLLVAKREHNLQPLLVQMPTQIKMARTVSAVVKSSSQIQKLSNLKGKKACFPSVDGMGWSAFTMAMRREGLLPAVCPNTKALSQFFSEICIAEPSSSVAEYSNIRTCLPESNSQSFEQETLTEVFFDDEAMAFQCLAFGGGDVAFISAEAIPKYLKDMKVNPEADGLTEASFREVCEEGAASNDCHLSWSSYAQVLVSSKVSKAKEEDVMSLFTGINNLFSHHNTPSTRTYDMFAPSNSLFPNFVSSEKPVQQRLEQFDDFLKKSEKWHKNYEKKLKSLGICTPSSASSTMLSIITKPFYLIFVIYYFSLI